MKFALQINNKYFFSCVCAVCVQYLGILALRNDLHPGWYCSVGCSIVPGSERSRVQSPVRAGMTSQGSGKLLLSQAGQLVRKQRRGQWATGHRQEHSRAKGQGQGLEVGGGRVGAGTWVFTGWEPWEESEASAEALLPLTLRLPACTCRGWGVVGRLPLPSQQWPRGAAL